MTWLQVQASLQMLGTLFARWFETSAPERADRLVPKDLHLFDLGPT